MKVFQIVFDVTPTGVALQMLEEPAVETKFTFAYGTLVWVERVRIGQMVVSPPVDVGNIDLR